MQAKRQWSNSNAEAVADVCYGPGQHHESKAREKIGEPEEFRGVRIQRDETNTCNALLNYHSAPPLHT
jgi:hypothetical protein